MRTLVLTRGVPASGKSTFVEKNGLLPFTISLDIYRQHFRGLVLGKHGEFCISNESDKEVMKLRNKVMEQRMQRGEFIVYDATNLVTNKLDVIKKMSKRYRYRVVMIDFMDGVTLEEIIRRDSEREPYKRVGENVISRMWSNYQRQIIPKWIEVVSPNNFVKTYLEDIPTDLSHYKKIVHIGDIHGCSTVLHTYLNGRLREDTYYIFTGDYLERGVENVEVMEYLLKIYTLPNVMMLKGNHESYLWEYANDEHVSSKDFNVTVKPSFDKAKIDKKKLRIFCRKLRTKFLYTYKGKIVLATHGGISNMPNYLSLVSDEQLIRGVGDYSYDVDAYFTKAVGNQEFYQVHGHRNILGKEVVNGKSINLEGGVETGRFLRVAELDEDGWEGIEVKNDIFDSKFIPKEVDEHTTVDELIHILKENRYVRETDNGNGIHSFNFTSEAFYDGVWTSQTVRARGLHIDVIHKKIVARSFDKFFDLSEYDLTKDVVNGGIH